jgi:hypothetical protein
MVYIEKAKYSINMSIKKCKESDTVKEKQKTHIAILIGLIIVYGVLAPQAKGKGLGNIIKDGLIGAATGDVAGSIAIGAGVRAVKGDSAKTKQAKAERAETERMRARKSERAAEQKAKAAYEAKLREQKQRQQHIDFRKPEQRRQIREISGDMHGQPDINQHKKAVDDPSKDKK